MVNYSASQATTKFFEVKRRSDLRLLQAFYLFIQSYISVPRILYIALLTYLFGTEEGIASQQNPIRSCSLSNTVF